MQDEMTSLSLLLLALGLFAALIKTHLELTSIKQRYRRYDALLSKEDFEHQLDSNIYLKQDELAGLETQREGLIAQVNTLQHKLADLQDDELVRSLDFYQPKYRFPDARTYRERLKQVKLEQRKMETNSTAVISHGKLTLDGNSRKGKQLVKAYTKLILEAFKTECKSIVSKAKSTNIEKQETAIINEFNKLNKLSKNINCEINQEYCEWWIRELHLTYEAKEKEQEEKEQERFIREQRKRERKEQIAIEKAKQEAEEAERREIQHQEAIEKVARELEKAIGQQREELENDLKELEQLRSAAQADKENAIQRSQNYNIGYIFVVSSPKSLGQGVYKICMTQSDDEDRYVRDMNPAIPFPYEVHYKIYSENISYTLGKLHEYLDEYRVNKFNLRRDFFRVSLEEIDRAINIIDDETGFFRDIDSPK